MLKIIIFCSVMITTSSSFGFQISGVGNLEKMHLRASSGVTQVSEAPDVYEVSEGYLLTGGRIVNREHLVIGNISRWYARQAFCDELASLVDFRPSTVNVVKETKLIALVDSLGPNNYFHWMVQIIPRLFAARLTGLAPDHYVFPPIETKFQAETMELLELPGGAVIHTPSGKGQAIRFERLLAPQVEFLPVQGRTALPRWIRAEWFKTLSLTP